MNTYTVKPEQLIFRIERNANRDENSYSERTKIDPSSDAYLRTGKESAKDFSSSIFRPSSMTTKTPVTSRTSYAGLKILPGQAYRKLRVYDTATENYDTHFQCLFKVHGEGDNEACNKVFVKSTSLIVHYQRHVNLRPFKCKLCSMSFTQSGTLTRHFRALHKDAAGSSSVALITLRDMQCSIPENEQVKEIKEENDE